MEIWVDDAEPEEYNLYLIVNEGEYLPEALDVFARDDCDKHGNPRAPIKRLRRQLNG